MSPYLVLIHLLILFKFHIEFFSFTLNFRNSFLYGLLCNICWILALGFYIYYPVTPFIQRYVFTSSDVHIFIVIILWIYYFVPISLHCALVNGFDNRWYIWPVGISWCHISVLLLLPIISSSWTSPVFSYQNRHT